MTRNNSSCKLRTLVFNCACGGAAVCGCLFGDAAFQPVYTLLNIRSRTRFSDMSNPDVYSSVCKDLRDSLLVNVPAAVLLLILALVAGISAFRYLHVKNQTDFFHALPIRRGQLFASRVLTGILAVLPSYLIGVLLSCAVIAAHGYGEILNAPEIVSSIAAHARWLFARVCGRCAVRDCVRQYTGVAARVRMVPARHFAGLGGAGFAAVCADAGENKRRGGFAVVESAD